MGVDSSLCEMDVAGATRVRAPRRHAAGVIDQVGDIGSIYIHPDMADDENFEPSTKYSSHCQHCSSPDNLVSLYLYYFGTLVTGGGIGRV